MEIPQVDEAWITRQLDDELYRDRLSDEFKFILVEGPANVGYVRFQERGLEHQDILSMFHRELATAGQNRALFSPRGGGITLIVGLEQMLKDFGRDFERRQPAQYTLRTRA